MSGDIKRSGVIRSVSRALIVLEALAGARFVSAADIAARCRLPRPTVYRILETLTEAGYVQRAANSEAFYLTSAVRDLGRNFTLDAEAIEVAAEVIATLSRALDWPVDFSTYENGMMVVRHSNHRTSPRSLISKANVGLRLSMVRTSPGLAFLAHLARTEAEAVLAQAPAGERIDSLVWQRREMAQKLGYASRQGGSLPKTSSIAVPVLSEGRPMGSINLMFIRSAMSIETAAGLYLDDLLEAAREIEARLRERRDNRLSDIETFGV